MARRAEEQGAAVADRSRVAAAAQVAAPAHRQRAGGDRRGTGVGVRAVERRREARVVARIVEDDRAAAADGSGERDRTVGPRGRPALQGQDESAVVKAADAQRIGGRVIPDAAAGVLRARTADGQIVGAAEIEAAVANDETVGNGKSGGGGLKDLASFPKASAADGVVVGQDQGSGSRAAQVHSPGNGVVARQGQRAAAGHIQAGRARKHGADRAAADRKAMRCRRNTLELKGGCDSSSGVAIHYGGINRYSEKTSSAVAATFCTWNTGALAFPRWRKSNLSRTPHGSVDGGSAPSQGACRSRVAL